MIRIRIRRQRNRQRNRRRRRKSKVKECQRSKVKSQRSKVFEPKSPVNYQLTFNLSNSQILKSSNLQIFNPESFRDKSSIPKAFGTNLQTLKFSNFQTL